MGMLNKLNQWMEDIDEKRRSLLHLSDDFQIPKASQVFQDKQGQNFQIRLGTVDDIESIVAVEELAYQGKIPWQARSIWNDMVYNQHALYFLAQTQEGQLAAFMGMWVAEGNAHITNLCVVPIFQRRGLASFFLSLLDSLVEDLGIDRTSLEVRSSNQSAQQLYVENGFFPRTVVKNYYRDDGEDAIKMVKSYKQEDGHGQDFLGL